MPKNMLPFDGFTHQYHFSVMMVLIIVQLIKLWMMDADNNGLLFVTVRSAYFGDKVIDAFEGLMLSPRFMALFTISFLHGATVRPEAKEDECGCENQAVV